jgi:PAS domain S-box-containing protein
MRTEPHKEHILLIDDEPDDVELTSGALQKMNAHGSITIARTAEEGLTLAGQQDWTMIFLDHKLPHKNGLEVLPEIRLRAPEAGIVMLTGHEDAEIAIAALRAGADYYLRKSANMALEVPLVAREVAEKRDLRRTLAQTTDRYRRLIENMTDLVYELDEEGRFRYISAAVVNLLGYTPQELIGMHYSRILSQDHLTLHGRQFHERRTGLRATRDLPIRLKTKTGEVKTFAVNSSGIYERHRRCSGTAGIARDITERQQKELALQRSEQMLRWTLDQQERLALDLHDGSIQSLYGIGLGLEYMLQLLGNDHEEISARLKEARDGMNSVIDQLRNFLVNAHPDFVLPMDLEGAMESLVQAAHHSTPIRFTLAIDPDALARLNAETSTQILFILREAISNISKHAQATTGVIRLETSDGRVRLGIEDNGVGFNLESRQGAGHGLDNMHTRAQKIGAAFDIVSAPGRGTHLTLTLPNEEGSAED